VSDYDDLAAAHDALAAALETGEVAPCAGCGELYYANDLNPVDPFADDTAWLCDLCWSGDAPLPEVDVQLGPAGRQALG
jgi:hypothetical protein